MNAALFVEVPAILLSEVPLRNGLFKITICDLKRLRYRYSYMQESFSNLWG